MFDWFDSNTAMPEFVMFGILLVHLLVVLLTGRVAIARGFDFRLRYASRRDAPAGYWFLVLVQLGMLTAIAWWALLAGGVEAVLPPGTPAIVDRVTPWAILTVAALYGVAVFVAGRRRRARLRAAHPSAIERASGGV